MSQETEALQRAFSYHLKTGAALLYAWKGNQTPERIAELADLEAKGLRLGLSLTIPADRWIATVVLLDQAGGFVSLATIEPELAGGASFSVN